MVIFQISSRFSSCGVLLGEVMVAFTEHPVVDVVLVVEDTALGSTNIQVIIQVPITDWKRRYSASTNVCNCATFPSRRSKPITLSLLWNISMVGLHKR